VLTGAAIMAVAGVAVALVVRTGGGSQELPMIGGEGSGTVTLEPDVVEPREPATTRSPSTPEATIAPNELIGDPDGAVPTTVLTTGPAGPGVTVGSVGGLYPGHRVELGVTYVNPYSFPIAIDTVNVTATGTDRCSARYLRAAPAPRLRLTSGASVDSALDVGMRRSAPDACQGVRFAVSVQVTAVQL
jgi:hypothetical protein